MTTTVFEIASVFVNTKLSEEDKRYIQSLDSKDLIVLHHTLGAQIRNEYGLWHWSPLTAQWRNAIDERIMLDGIDHSPDHPDAISMQIIEIVYQLIHSDVV